MQTPTKQTLATSEMKNVNRSDFSASVPAKQYVLFDWTYFSAAYFSKFPFSLKTTVKDMPHLLIFVREIDIFILR